MRIGIDGSCLANRRGFGRFARQLLAALARVDHAHELVVIIDRPSLAKVEIPGGCETVVVDLPRSAADSASATGRRCIGDMLAMGRAAAGASLDVMYFPASYTFFPVWNAGRVIVTLHDTLAFTHPSLVFPTWQGRLAWSVKEQLAVRWAHRIVTVSEASRRDLVARFGLDDRRIRTITEGPEACFERLPRDGTSDAALARHGVVPGSRFLLAVGGLSPHKNLSRLVEAFATAAPADARLVLVGDFNDNFHTHVPELRRTIERVGADARVHFTGFVPDADLAHLYNRAVALAFPSLLEGFGLPAVEAMACGTPVIHSTAGSLPEVVGDAGLAFEATATDGIARAIEQIFGDPALRAGLAANALVRARAFTWERAARLLLACLDECDPNTRGHAGHRSAMPAHHVNASALAPRRESTGRGR